MSTGCTGVLVHQLGIVLGVSSKQTIIKVKNKSQSCQPVSFHNHQCDLKFDGLGPRFELDSNINRIGQLSRN